MASILAGYLHNIRNTQFHSQLTLLLRADAQLQCVNVYPATYCFFPDPHLHAALTSLKTLIISP